MRNTPMAPFRACLEEFFQATRADVSAVRGAGTARATGAAAAAAAPAYGEEKDDFSNGIQLHLSPEEVSYYAIGVSSAEQMRDAVWSRAGLRPDHDSHWDSWEEDNPLPNTSGGYRVEPIFSQVPYPLSPLVIMKMDDKTHWVGIHGTALPVIEGARDNSTMFRNIGTTLSRLLRHSGCRTSARQAMPLSLIHI